MNPNIALFCNRKNHPPICEKGAPPNGELQCLLLAPRSIEAPRSFCPVANYMRYDRCVHMLLEMKHVKTPRNSFAAILG